MKLLILLALFSCKTAVEKEATGTCESVCIKHGGLDKARKLDTDYYCVCEGGELEIIDENGKSY